jgi:hypothetical protein
VKGRKRFTFASFENANFARKTFLLRTALKVATFLTITENIFKIFKMNFLWRKTQTFEKISIYGIVTQFQE